MTEQMLSGELTDKRIAELLGWQFVHKSYMNDGSFLIYSPDGVEMFHGTPNNWTSVFPAGSYNDVIPRYSTDLNAAFRLIESEIGTADFEVSLEPIKRLWCASISPYTEHHWTEKSTASGDSLAFAICTAWLWWKERHK